jgi:hypothetical protein
MEITIQNHISAAFDSVNLINQTVLLDKTDQNKNSVKRNFEHLEIKLADTEFAEALTAQQKNDIEASIQLGKDFIN